MGCGADADCGQRAATAKLVELGGMGSPGRDGVGVGLGAVEVVRGVGDKGH